MIGKRGEMWFTWMDFWGTNLSFNTTKMHKFVMFGREMWFTWMDFWGWDIQSLSVLGRAVVLPRLAAPAFSGPSGKKGVDYLDIWHLEKKVMITWTSEFWITWITWTVTSQFWREKKTPRTLSGVTEGWTNITEIRCMLYPVIPQWPHNRL